MGDPPYALAPAQIPWAGAAEDDMPAIVTTGQVVSEDFSRTKENETMFKKKQLLPKDLAARAEKVDPAKVEAEVLRIISAKPAALSPMDPHFVPGWRGMLQPGSLVPATRNDIARQALQLQQAYTAEMQQQNQQWGGFLQGP
jgi:hypothetical protein